MSHGHTDPQTPGEEGAPLTPGPPAQQPSAAGTLAEGAVPDTALRAEVPKSQAGLRAQARDWNRGSRQGERVPLVAEGAGAEATARPATVLTQTQTGAPTHGVFAGRCLQSQPSVSGSAPWGLPGHLL